MLSSIFGQKLRAKQIEATRTRVTPSEGGAGPASPSRRPPPPKGGYVGRQERQITRQLTLTKIEKTKEKMSEIHSKQVDNLVSNMRSNIGQMRQKFADTSLTIEQFKQHESELSKDIGSADDAAVMLHVFNEEMEGDFELMNHKPAWNAAIDRFLTAALGNDPTVEVTSSDLAKFLCDVIPMAEPQIQPCAAAVVRVAAHTHAHAQRTRIALSLATLSSHLSVLHTRRSDGTRSIHRCSKSSTRQIRPSCSRVRTCATYARTWSKASARRCGG